MDKQIELPLIEHKVELISIKQRANDGYVNATALCQAVNKQFNDYFRLKTTSDFLNELSSETGIPVSELVQVIKGGTPNLQGTWVHPQVAINLGQWASPKFAVLVSQWVIEWSSGGQKKAFIPFHIKRYLINRHKIPADSFSMLDQMTLRLLAPLENKGYIIADKLMPDIALGKMFCKWLREQGYNPDKFQTYSHVFADGLRPVVQAKLYPNQIMTAFNLQLDKWIREKSLKYFETKDKTAIPALKQVYAELPPPQTEEELSEFNKNLKKALEYNPKDDE